MAKWTFDAGNPEAALVLLDQLLSVENQFDDAFSEIKFGDWPEVHVYLPKPTTSSSITPPFMEAFLELQKQIYQLAAQATTGSSDSGQLSEALKDRLQISVVVTGGSSDLRAKLEKVMPELLTTMIGKMTGKQAAVVIVCLATLIAGHWSFSAWLEQRRVVQIEELKSKDHVEALRALSLSGTAHVDSLTKIIAILEKQGEIGQRAIEAVSATNDALLKAATKSNESVINDTHLSRQEAEILRTTPRKKPELRLATQRMRVLDINTSDPNELSILLSTPDRKLQYRIKFVDGLFSKDDRKALFDALDSRDSIWMELAFREIDGDVRSVQFVRTTAAPQSTSSLDASD